MIDTAINFAAKRMAEQAAQALIADARSKYEKTLGKFYNGEASPLSPASQESAFQEYLLQHLTAHLLALHEQLTSHVADSLAGFERQLTSIDDDVSAESARTIFKV